MIHVTADRQKFSQAIECIRRAISAKSTIVALSCALSASGCGGSTLRFTELDEVLKSAQYERLNPPSNLYRAAAIVRVLGREPLRLQMICPADSLQNGAALVLASDTDNTDIKKLLNREIKVEGKAFSDAVAGKAELAQVQEITMSLQGARLFELPSSAKTGVNVTRSDDCVIALQVELGNHPGEIALIRSTYNGTVDYRVHTKDSATTKVDAPILEALKSSLKLEGASTDEATGTITGPALVWGVRVDTGPILCEAFPSEVKETCQSTRPPQ